VIAFDRLGRWPSALDLLLCLVLLAASTLVIYSLWVLVICAAFWVVRLENLAYLFSSIFDAARWPLDIFRGWWRIIFTFVIPLGLMTTYPARAILGKLDAQTALAALAGSLAIATLSRMVWLTALRRYTSASS